MLAPSDRAENSHGTKTTRPKSMGAIMLIIQIIRTTTARVASMHAIILTVSDIFMLNAIIVGYGKYIILHGQQTRTVLLNKC